MLTKRHILCLVSCCLLAWAALGTSNSYGVFYTALAEKLNAPRSAVTLHISISSLVTGFSSLFMSQLIRKRVRVSILVICGMVLILFSGTGIALSNRVALLNMFGLIRGLGFSFIWMMLITVIISNWFHKNLATFTGIVFAFSGIGAAIASPVLTHFIGNYGLSKTYIGYMIFISLLMVPAIFFCQLSPEEKGLNPYGYEEGRQVDFNVRRARVKGPFPLFLLLFLTFCSVAISGINSHLPSIALTSGFTASQAALVLSASMVGNVVSKFLLGTLSDRIGTVKSHLVILAAAGCGLVTILFAKTNPVLLTGGFLFGFCFSIGSLGLSTMTRTMYGDELYTKMYSYSSIVTCVAGALMITLYSLIYDLTKSYRAVIIFASCITILAIITVTLIGRKIRKSPQEI